MERIGLAARIIGIASGVGLLWLDQHPDTPGALTVVVVYGLSLGWFMVFCVTELAEAVRRIVVNKPV